MKLISFTRKAIALIAIFFLVAPVAAWASPPGSCIHGLGSDQALATIAEAPASLQDIDSADLPEEGSESTAKAKDALFPSWAVPGCAPAVRHTRLVGVTRPVHSIDFIFSLYSRGPPKA